METAVIREQMVSHSLNIDDELARKVTGAEADDGSLIEAGEIIDGGLSVLFDAVALFQEKRVWLTF